MKIDFDKIEEAQNYDPLPEGKYLCELAEIEEKQTQNGDEMWNLKFVVIQQKYEGRVIFDRMVFSEKAMNRVKLICSRLGMDTKGVIDLQPQHLLHNRCYLNVIIEDYTDKEGLTKKRNSVPFSGYEKTEELNKKVEAQVNHELQDDDIPF